MSTVPKASRDLVWERATWPDGVARCERCGTAVEDRFYSIHHRRVKGMGGDRRPDTDLPANLVLLCGSGTTGCHGRVHHERAWASEVGWTVSRHASPAEVPLPLCLYGLVFLGDDGSVRPATQSSPLAGECQTGGTGSS